MAAIPKKHSSKNSFRVSSLGLSSLLNSQKKIRFADGGFLKVESFIWSHHHYMVLLKIRPAITINIRQYIKFMLSTAPNIFLDHLILHLQPPGASQCGAMPSSLGSKVCCNAVPSFKKVEPKLGKRVWTF